MKRSKLNTSAGSTGTLDALGHRVGDAFTERFGEEPQWLIRAPGRVNLIGEHTDYNDGFVLPMAIDRAVWLAVRPRKDSQVSVWSLDYEEEAGFDLSEFQRGDDAWIEYLKACAWALQEKGLSLTGWEGVLAGDVPHGAGLSSSAALELATLRAFSAASGIPWLAAEMALTGQRAENEWVGVNCGIMDQMISARGEDGHALLIDCRTLESEAVPLPIDSVAVILDTSTRRGLVDSAYNERRQQCEEASRLLGVPALRDLTPAHFESEAHRLDPTTRRRARHVVTENARTLAAAIVMRQGDARRLGELMNESHASLRDDFEVSTPELDLFSALARDADGCFGARMTGAGFGGCAVALVSSAAVPDFVQRVSEAYRSATGLVPALYVSRATAGARIVATSGETRVDGP
ncbi:MAG: galactokinase [Rhodothermales bacterium]|jgi:galactokinase